VSLLPQLGGVSLLPCVGRHGLVIMSADWLGVGIKLTFGRMCGLAGCLLG